MIAWSDALLSHHDSAWGVVQKLAWMNDTSPNDIMRLCVGARPPPLGSKQRTYRIHDWLTSVSSDITVVSVEGMDLAAFLLHRIHDMVRLPRPLAPARERLRVCTTCISTGYHSVLHQLDPFERCLIHDQPLVENCPHCGTSLGAYGFREARRAFACSRCDRSLLANEEKVPRMTPEEKDYEQRTIGSVIAWINQFEAQRFKPRLEVPLAPSADSDAPFFHPLQAVLWHMHSVSPFPISTRLLGPEPTHARYILRWKDAGGGLRHRPAKSNKDSRDGHARLKRECARIVSKIEAKIRTHHSTCLRDADELVRVQSEFGTRFAVPVPDFCSVGQGHFVWKRRLAAELKDAADAAQLGCVPLLDEVMIEEIEQDLWSSLYQCIQAINWWYEDPESHGYERATHQTLEVTIDPWIDLNPHDPTKVEAPPVQIHVLKLDYSYLVENLPCDHGAARKAHWDRYVSMMQSIRSGQSRREVPPS